MRKVGLFGGSFDPIHKAHIQIATLALEQLQLDEIQLIPTQNNPWKDKSGASEQDRLAMIQIAIQDYPYITVNTVELDIHSDEKNYTIQTIKTLLKQNQDIEYYYIMGMDQANLFYKWKNAKEMSQLVHLVAFQRGGYKKDQDILKKYHFKTLNNEPITASSSAIREGQLDQLDEKVLKYISSKGIYLETIVASFMSKKRWKHTCSVAKLAAEIAKANDLDERQAYIAGMLHDVAKEMDNDEAQNIMEKHYSQFINKPKAIWHQWLSRYVSETLFLVEDEVILKAIEDHTTASTSISLIGKCVYVADKLDPTRGYDSSKQIQECKNDINQGFRNALIDFYEFSKSKGRDIDPCFFEIYEHYVKKGEI